MTHRLIAVGHGGKHGGGESASAMIVLYPPGVACAVRNGTGLARSNTVPREEVTPIRTLLPCT